MVLLVNMHPSFCAIYIYDTGVFPTQPSLELNISITSPSTRNPDAVDVSATTLAQINVQVTYPASIIRAVPYLLRGTSDGSL